MRHHFMALVMAAAATSVATSAASAMSLNFSWAGTRHCSHQNPAFQLGGVPPGTARLAFRLIDLDFRPFPHGGGMIPFQGPSVPAGAFSYIGPCPPPGHTHRYQWTVRALDAGGRTLATASSMRPFSSP